MRKLFVFAMTFATLMGAPKTYYIYENGLWKGKSQENLTQKELDRRRRCLEEVVNSLEPTCFEGAWLYGKKDEHLEGMHNGVVVVCPDKAWQQLATEVAEQVCEQVWQDIKNGINPEDILIVAPMRGALPLMGECYKLLWRRLVKRNYGMPQFSPTVQQRRRQTTGLGCQEKVALHTRLKGRPYKAVYFVDDVTRSGGTLADGIVNALIDFPSVSRVRIFLLFGAQSSDSMYQFSRLLPGSNDTVAMYGSSPDPAKKFQDFGAALQRVFGRKVDCQYWAARHLLSKGRRLWLMSPFEAAAPEVELEGQKSYLMEMLETVKAFAQFSRGRTFENIRCIMVPAIAVFAAEELNLIYKKSFWTSNEAGDFCRYRRYIDLLPFCGAAAYKRDAIEAAMPKMLASLPGVICSPYVRADLIGGSYVFEVGDPFAADREAIRTSLEVDEITPGDTMVVLYGPLGHFSGHKSGLTALYQGLKKRLIDYGYQVFDMSEEPTFYRKANVYKTRVFPILNLDQRVEGHIRRSPRPVLCSG